MGRYTGGRTSRVPRWLGAGATVVALSTATPARAYTVSTFVSDGCHEQITDGALRAARALGPDVAPALGIDATDRAFVDDLPFELPAGSDLAAVTLLVGVRDNDLKGRGSTDLQDLALIHGNPTTQDEHCLRDLDDDEPDGTARAVARCRGFSLGRVGDALDHLAVDGTPDVASRVTFPVALAIRGETTVQLPGFYVHLGQALHALQDSFSHSYRTADSLAITTSLTWLHPIDDDLDESVTGPPHSAVLDRCVGLDMFRAARLAVAGEASRALLVAALGPGTRASRLDAASGVLDTYLPVQPGCAADNVWCAAPEHAYGTAPALGCGVAGGGRVGWLGLGGGARAARRGGGVAVGAAGATAGRASVGRDARAAVALAAVPAWADGPLRPDVPDERVTSAARRPAPAERPRFGLAVRRGRLAQSHRGQLRPSADGCA